ncbi:hypothetical protein EVAR_84878_1 [Eumeta japonica]|uniref:Uncharacterized protein n=1 Tax=Eumeta variegata TaxID=151549 RepID=A0A4C1YHP9_EUMVA|nr:hypothetical protein EVAR_84878_1 [Eumeta japonica]
MLLLRVLPFRRTVSPAEIDIKRGPVVQHKYAESFGVLQGNEITPVVCATQSLELQRRAHNPGCLLDETCADSTLSRNAPSGLVPVWGSIYCTSDAKCLFYVREEPASYFRGA